MNFTSYKEFAKEKDGEEIYMDELKVLKLLLECEFEDILFTHTDEDCDEIYLISDKLSTIKHSKEINGYLLYDWDGLELVYKYEDGGLIEIFINKKDEQKIEKYV